MSSARTSESEAVRARLDHPVIDTDGHTVELSPLYHDYLRELGGSDMPRRYAEAMAARSNSRWSAMTEAERRNVRAHCPPWWARPANNTLDRATASLPRLLHERMDRLGIDFAVLYPTEGLSGPPRFEDEELRRVSCRALNKFHAEFYGECSDRMTPAAVIPTHTPREAIEDTEYAVRELGLKTIVIAHVDRPVPRVQEERPDLAPFARYIDTLALDSDFDYDPFWQRCVELGVAPTSHASGQGWGSRRSVSNYMYNHIGHFAAAGEALCKALFFGGVTYRFPTLNFAFLECGVAWACSLYSDILEHWEKRNRDAIAALDPESTDLDLMMKLVAEYGGIEGEDKLAEIRASIGRKQRRPENLDDWSRCGIDRAEDIRDRFVPRFYFGCEADDRMIAWAFNDKLNPFGARLGAMMSSDIGHWDVTDMTGVVAEAHELVDRGHVTGEDFRDFCFTNAVRFYAGVNPDFFAGTVCEEAAARLVAAS